MKKEKERSGIFSRLSSYNNGSSQLDVVVSDATIMNSQGILSPEDKKEMERDLLALVDRTALNCGYKFKIVVDLNASSKL